MESREQKQSSLQLLREQLDSGAMRRVGGTAMRNVDVRIIAASNKELRAEVDERNEKLGYKIREAQVLKIPYMLAVGAREREAGTVNVRRRAGGELGAMFGVGGKQALIAQGVLAGARRPQATRGDSERQRPWSLGRVARQNTAAG